MTLRDSTAKSQRAFAAALPPGGDGLVSVSTPKACSHVRLGILASVTSEVSFGELGLSIG